MSDPDAASAKVIQALVSDVSGKRRTRGGTKRPATAAAATDDEKETASAAAAAAAATATAKRARLRQPFADASKLTEEMASLIEHGLLSPGNDALTVDDLEEGYRYYATVNDLGFINRLDHLAPFVNLKLLVEHVLYADTGKPPPRPRAHRRVNYYTQVKHRERTLNELLKMLEASRLSVSKMDSTVAAAKDMDKFTLFEQQQLRLPPSRRRKTVEKFSFPVQDEKEKKAKAKAAAAAAAAAANSTDDEDADEEEDENGGGEVGDSGDDDDGDDEEDELPPKQMKCPFKACSLKYSNRSSLGKHLRSKHSTNFQELSEEAKKVEDVRNKRRAKNRERDQARRQRLRNEANAIGAEEEVAAPSKGKGKQADSGSGGGGAAAAASDKKKRQSRPKGATSKSKAKRKPKKENKVLTWQETDEYKAKMQSIFDELVAALVLSNAAAAAAAGGPAAITSDTMSVDAAGDSPEDTAAGSPAVDQVPTPAASGAQMDMDGSGGAENEDGTDQINGAGSAASVVSAAAAAVDLAASLNAVEAPAVVTAVVTGGDAKEQAVAVAASAKKATTPGVAVPSTGVPRPAAADEHLVAGTVTVPAVVEEAGIKASPGGSAVSSAMDVHSESTGVGVGTGSATATFADEGLAVPANATLVSNAGMAPHVPLGEVQSAPAPAAPLPVDGTVAAVLVPILVPALASAPGTPARAPLAPLAPESSVEAAAVDGAPESDALGASISTGTAASSATTHAVSTAVSSTARPGIALEITARTSSADNNAAAASTDAEGAASVTAEADAVPREHADGAAPHAVVRGEDATDVSTVAMLGESSAAEEAAVLMDATAAPASGAAAASTASTAATAVAASATENAEREAAAIAAEVAEAAEAASLTAEVTENVRQPRSARRARRSKLYQALSAGPLDPYTMIKCDKYEGANANEQPFSILVESNATLMMDIHCHLASTEVIGYIAGHWDSEAKRLRIVTAKPCRALEPGPGQKREQSVEMDPMSELSVKGEIDEAGLQVVGWYHSHPVFKPEPSVRDIENQLAQQKLFEDVNNGFAPFLGVIISPYERSQADRNESQMQCFWIDTEDKELLKRDVPLGNPMAFDYQIVPSAPVDIPLLSSLRDLMDRYAIYPERIVMSTEWRRTVSKIEKLKVSLRDKLPSETVGSDDRREVVLRALGEMMEAADQMHTEAKERFAAAGDPVDSDDGGGGGGSGKALACNCAPGMFTKSGPFGTGASQHVCPPAAAKAAAPSVTALTMMEPTYARSAVDIAASAAAAAMPATASTKDRVQAVYAAVAAVAASTAAATGALVLPGATFQEQQAALMTAAIQAVHQSPGGFWAGGLPPVAAMPQSVAARTVTAPVAAAAAYPKPEPTQEPKGGGFKCPHCSKSFAKPFTLKRHMAIHVGEMNHICEHCKRKFNRKDALSAHKKACKAGDRPGAIASGPAVDFAAEDPQSVTAVGLPVAGEDDID